MATVERLTARHGDVLAALFATIAADLASQRFHPHAFDEATAQLIATYAGRDIYLGLIEGAAITGYGMLRGWDQGYAVPSLGIYLAPPARGRGLARILMQALHEHARAAGAKRVRLKVYPDNAAAIRLYEGLGYVFADVDAGQRVGILELGTARQ